MKVLTRFILTAVCVSVVMAVCTFPENLRDSNWTDSDKGTLIFTSTHMTGWEFTDPDMSSGTGILDPQWECFHNETGTVTTLILKADTTIDLSGTIYRPFLCLRMTAITSYSYYYYVHAYPDETAPAGAASSGSSLFTAEQALLNYERVNVLFETSVSTISNPEADVCTFTTVDTTDNEYHVLVKEGFEADAIQTCPSAFFGQYTYSVTDQDASSSSCGAGNEIWDVCTDRQFMTFDYTLCNTPVAYSANGNVSCVVSLTSGSYVLHTVYNQDTSVDNINTYRFTCFVSSLSSDGSLTTSQSPRSCTKSQTPSTQPTHTNGTVVGLNIALTPIALTTDSESSSTVAVGAIAGGTIGGIALIVIIALLVYLCLKHSLCSRLCRRIGSSTKKSQKPRDKPIEKTKKHKDTTSEHTEKSKENGKQSHRDSQTGNQSHRDSLIAADAPIDIEKMNHTRYPHWIHGPRGTAPSGTAIQGDKEIRHLPSFVVRDTTSLLSPTYDQSPPVFSLSKTQENGGLNSKSLLKSESNQNTNRYSTANGVKPSASRLMGDNTLMSTRSSISSRASFKSTGMISLHGFDTERESFKGQNSKMVPTLSNTGQDKTLDKHVARNDIQIASKDLSSKKTKSNDTVKGNSNVSLQKSVTCISLGNKAGTFHFDPPDVPDMTIRDVDMEHGIAYDDDNQFEMEQGYNTGANETVEDLEWKYGAGAPIPMSNKEVKWKTQLVVVKDVESNTHPVNAVQENEEALSDQAEDDTGEEYEEGEEEEIANPSFAHRLDADDMTTAVSITYSSNEIDPDQMHVTYHRSLTPTAD